MKTLIIGAIGIKPSLTSELKNRFKDAKVITSSQCMLVTYNASQHPDKFYRDAAK
jgi:hypothetical protein